MDCVTTTNITELPLLSRGKVRDIYEAGPDSLLIITTDRNESEIGRAHV